MRWYRRSRWMSISLLSGGTCFAALNCLNEAGITGLRIGASSFTLPVNQWISGGYNLITVLIANTIASLVVPV